MKVRSVLILFSTFLMASAGAVLAQSNADETFQDLRAQLSDVQNKEAELKILLEQLDFELRPENIERHFNGHGSLHPEKLREMRQRQLQIEKDHLLVQQEQLASERSRLELAINEAQVRLYQQSVQQSIAAQPDEKFRPGRVLIAAIPLLMVLTLLGVRGVMRRRRHS